jgi:hypothetical protein
MILISHQRSGSEWFLGGLVDHTYNGWEIFGDMENLTVNFSKFKSIGFDARFAMLKTMPANKVHKLHVVQIMQICAGHWPYHRDAEARAAEFVKFLKEHNSLYILKRRNIRAALISFMIAKYNQYNFHQDPAKLQTPFRITHADIFRWNRSFTADFDWVENSLPIQETFIYEDLLAGSQVPSTLNWDSSRSKIVKRGSLKYLELVQNLDEVQEWMDILNIPGSLSSD